MLVSATSPVSMPPPAGARGHDALRDALNLSLPGRGGLVEQAAALAPAEREGFLGELATLLRAGVVGTETRFSEGRATERFIEVGLADERLRGTRPARPGETAGRVLDLRA
jgi:hypothetical protein